MLPLALPILLLAGLVSAFLPGQRKPPTIG